MQGFFFIDEPEEVQPKPEPVVQSPSSWPFPIVNGVRTVESQDLINKGHTYGT